MNNTLDESHRRILAYIQAFTEQAGYPPSYAEIAEACALPTVGHVQYRIARLEALGYVARQPRRARSLRVLRPAPSVEFRRPRGWRRVKAIFTEPGAWLASWRRTLSAPPGRRIARSPRGSRGRRLTED